MTGTLPDQNQRDIFTPLLTDFIDLTHELVQLADAIDWTHFETEFADLYSPTGQPAVPIRLMVGCLLLKHLFNLGDETLARDWIRDPYMQYFCGQAHFQHAFPFDPSDFVHFRKRVGATGMEIIFAYSVQMHGSRATAKYGLSDTTVQENHITFPTDAKLAKKVIDGCNRIARAENLRQRQSYVRVSKQLLRDSYNGNHPRRRKKAVKARRKLRTIAGRLIRELRRGLPEDRQAAHARWLELAERVITQQRSDKDKLYSLHKPFTCCIAKGKAHKPYEFGNKVGLITHPTRKLILAIQAFEGNPHDSQTIAPLLDQMEHTGQSQLEEIIYDRGGRGRKTINGVRITTPDKPKAADSQNKRRRMRRRFRQRAGIEGLIGHLKTDHRMAQNFLHGPESPQMNALLAAAAWNMKKWMEWAVKNGRSLRWLIQKWWNILHTTPATMSC